MSDADWLDRLRHATMADGYFSSLGGAHSAVFVERDHSVLFVAFESLVAIRSMSETSQPLAFDVCESRGWSHLTIIGAHQNWFRDPRVFAYFDGLIDHGFFEEFDRVVFYGAGMCGYAAAAYSVAAPGASVILAAPQATLERPLTEWDDRFPIARRLDFSERYGNAPRMLEAAEQALVIFDPTEAEDAMHAHLLAGPNVMHHRYRRGQSAAIEADLRALGLVSALAEQAVEGAWTEAGVAELLRARQTHVPYLRALLARVLAEDRPALTARLCRAVLKDLPIPRFKHHLEAAEKRLKGESPPPGNLDASA